MFVILLKSEQTFSEKNIFIFAIFVALKKAGGLDGLKKGRGLVGQIV